jgi:hypothetical protein
MGRLFVLAATAVVLIGTCLPSYAGPCTAQIADVEKKIRKAQATAQPGGAGEPTAPQTVGAQLHHQPTPNSVESAERRATISAEAALERARNADAAGDAAACAKALQDARDLYGL